MEFGVNLNNLGNLGGGEPLFACVEAIERKPFSLQLIDPSAHFRHARGLSCGKELIGKE